MNPSTNPYLVLTELVHDRDNLKAYLNTAPQPGAAQSLAINALQGKYPNGAHYGAGLESLEELAHNLDKAIATPGPGGTFGDLFKTAKSEIRHALMAPVFKQIDKEDRFTTHHALMHDVCAMLTELDKDQQATYSTTLKLPPRPVEDVTPDDSRLNVELLVALSGQQPVGFIAYEKVWENGVVYLQVKNLYVLPKYRQQGLGKGLLTTVLNEATKTGCAVFQLNVLAENPLALKLYASLGLSPVKYTLAKRL